MAELSRVWVVLQRKYTVPEELKPVFFVCNDSRPSLACCVMSCLKCIMGLLRPFDVLEQANFNGNFHQNAAT